VQSEPVIAFATRDDDPPALQIRVNFGVFAGREATAAELDELGAALLEQVRHVSIVAEDRHEMSPESEAAVYQVRVDLTEAEDNSVLEGRLIQLAEHWARSCVAERHNEPAPSAPVRRMRTSGRGLGKPGDFPS
jgi:hypothetical protein